MVLSRRTNDEKLARGPSITFIDAVTDLTDLRSLMGEPSELARGKQLDHLDEHCRTYVAHSPFLVMETANRLGQCDVSPKGDAPGFVHVLDSKHIVIPERPGNRRLDGMQNTLENPQVGVIFFVPRYEETLRVNGRATIARDPALLARLEAGGKRPVVAIGVAVEEVFLRCAKAFKRSSLWPPAGWPDIAQIAPAARIFFDHARPAGQTPADVEGALTTSYTTKLY